MLFDTLQRSGLRMPDPRHLVHLGWTRELQISQTTRMAYKDDQKRESLKPKAHDYTISGTDEEVAASEDAAFNPNITSPEAAKETAGEGDGAGNPLEFSPANKEMAGGGQVNNEKKLRAGDHRKGVLD